MRKSGYVPLLSGGLTIPTLIWNRAVACPFLRRGSAGNGACHRPCSARFYERKRHGFCLIWSQWPTVRIAVPRFLKLPVSVPVAGLLQVRRTPHHNQPPSVPQRRPGRPSPAARSGSDARRNPPLPRTRMLRRPQRLRRLHRRRGTANRAMRPRASLRSSRPSPPIASAVLRPLALRRLAQLSLLVQQNLLTRLSRFAARWRCRAQPPRPPVLPVPLPQRVVPASRSQLPKPPHFASHP
jgi:hypothetical protein